MRKAERPAPLYASFRMRYIDIWMRYFDELFTVVGYLPMYDLLSEIYKQFRLFEIAPEEEGTLAKLLDVMKNFEETGQNNLKDFLAFVHDESDDADWNIAVPHGADAVSVMTIHKAKGLDNRVVIVLLVDTTSRSENLFVEEHADGIRLVHITQKNAAYSKTFQELYDRHRFERTVDDLNKLYVALTRAKEEMYVISMKTEYADEPSKFLPSSGYEPSVKPKVERQKQSIEPVVPLVHSSMRIPINNISSEKLALYERRRGDAIHKVLSQVEFAAADVETCISLSVKKAVESWMQPADEAHIKSLVLEFLHLPEIAPFFAYVENRKIMNEQEFVHPDGRLFRMDRIVVDAHTVTVLDFKTGDDKDAYTEQVQGYVNILQNFYPGRTIHGVLAFVDRKKLRVVV
jgi:ATP-dependent exoDNAse (exonuclease V) beta subunit